MSVALFQGLQFLLIARALGPTEFGKMAGVLALTSVLLPFSGVGFANIIVMRLARQEADAPALYGNALFVATVSGALLISLAAVLGPVFFNNAALLPLILVFGISEILFTKYIDISSHVFMGLSQYAYSGRFMAMLGLCRFLLATLFFVLVPTASASAWAWLHLCAGFLAFCVIFYITTRHIGRPRVSVIGAFRELKHGVFFSIGLSAKSVYTDIDKAVLARYAAHDISGAYTAAFRLIYMAFTPVMSVILAAQAKFFAKGGGHNGLRATTRYAARLASYGGLYCCVFAVAVHLLAPLVQWALGDAYKLSVEIITYMAFLPLVLMVQALLSEALTGANHQKLRSLAQVLAAALCLVLNVLLVPKMGWKGAIVASYAAQIVLALMAGLSIAFLLPKATAT